MEPQSTNSERGAPRPESGCPPKPPRRRKLALPKRNGGPPSDPSTIPEARNEDTVDTQPLNQNSQPGDEPEPRLHHDTSGHFHDTIDLTEEPEDGNGGAVAATREEESAEQLQQKESSDKGTDNDESGPTEETAKSREHQSQNGAQVQLLQVPNFSQLPYPPGHVLRGRYTVIRKWDKGAYGNVYRATDQCADNSDVAIKVTIRNDDATFRNAEDEARIVGELNRQDPHNKKCIVRLLDFFQSYSRVHLVFEFMPTTLRYLIATNPYGMAMREVQSVGYQLLLGLEFMHQCNMIHADLKPDNVICTTGFPIKLKIVDFGLTMQGIKIKRTCNVQSCSYRAPEISYQCETFGAAIDLWSIGCILGECRSGDVLFPASQNDTLNKLTSMTLGYPPVSFLARSMCSGNIKGFYAQLNANEIPNVPSGTVSPKLIENMRRKKNPNKPGGSPNPSRLDPQLIHLVANMLKYDPEERITASQALQNVMFRQGTKFKK